MKTEQEKEKRYRKDTYSYIPITDLHADGWSNYETWAVKFSLDNTDYHAGQRDQEDLLKEARRRGEQQREQQGLGEGDLLRLTVASLAALLHVFVNENIPSGEMRTDGLYSDLLGAAIANVNFTEIADSIIVG